jgi:hypothetical protein
MIETTSDEFTHCVLSPERIDEKGFVEGKVFGVGPDNDPTGIYDKIFNLTAKTYKILTFCIYEVKPNLIHIKQFCYFSVTTSAKCHRDSHSKNRSSCFVVSATSTSAIVKRTSLSILTT